MKKNNPMFVSSTHGAYDFVDFTAPPDQRNPPPPPQAFGQSPKHQQVRFEPKQEQVHQINAINMNSPPKVMGSPQRPFQEVQQQLQRPESPFKQTRSVMRQPSQEFAYNFQPTSPNNRRPEVERRQETPLKQFAINSKMESSKGQSRNYASGQDFTDDLLLDLLSEPHRSNIRALKMKSKSVPRLTF